LILTFFVVLIRERPSAIANASEVLEPIPDAERPQILARIRLELNEHQSSIDAIDVKWTRRDLARHSEPPKLMPFERRQWTRSGRRGLLFIEGLASLDAPAKVQSRYFFDGERGYALAYHRSDPTKLNNVRVLDGEPVSLEMADIPLLLGWNTVILRKSVITLLDAGDAKLLGKRQIDGALCYEVEFGPTPPPTDIPDPLLVVAWFDSQHGWLPRRICIGAESDFRDPDAYALKKTAQARWQSDVKSFQEVNDPLHQRTLFFPYDAELAVGRNLRHAIHLEEVTLNPTLAAAVFHPHIPDGVQLEEHHGTARYQRTVTGEDDAKAEHERSLEADRVAAGLVPETPRPAATPGLIDARPRPSSRLPYIMLSTSVLAFVVALGFLVVNRFRRRS